MLADVVVACTVCEAPLDDEDPSLIFETPEGRRHAYECACGAVTITVAATP
ncbi:MAG: hypothetical protein ABEJ71_03300 [Halodesulfurarchaeum sp.]